MHSPEGPSDTLRRFNVMLHVSLQHIIDQPWLRMEPIRVGPTRRHTTSPDAYITVALDREPFARIDVFADFNGPFSEVIVWRSSVVLGWGGTVHLVDPLARRTHSISCDGYFGHLYPSDARLLIASASELICIDEQWNELWHRDDLGIDGVVVDLVANGTVCGSGEWDPPGDWRPFRLDWETGKSLLTPGQG